MNWVGLLQNLGTFAIASGLLVWLFKVLVQQSLSRDLEAFKSELKKAHEIEMEEAKNRFTVGATSHMANVAFDKHVQFCEEYTAEVFAALDTLYREGPNRNVLAHPSNLYGIRTKWAVWLTPEIEKQLEAFETALRKIGANAYLLKQVPGEPEAIKEMYAEFASVLGEKHGFTAWEGRPVTKESSIEAVIAALRKVLGTDKLTELRSVLVERAGSEVALTVTPAGRATLTRGESV